MQRLCWFQMWCSNNKGQCRARPHFLWGLSLSLDLLLENKDKGIYGAGLSMVAPISPSLSLQSFTIQQLYLLYFACSNVCMYVCMYIFRNRGLAVLPRLVSNSWPQNNLCISLRSSWAHRHVCSFISKICLLLLFASFHYDSSSPRLCPWFLWDPLCLELCLPPASIKKYLWGQWEGSVGRGAYHQAWWPGVDLEDTNGGRREVAPAGWPLTSTGVLWHLCGGTQANVEN